MLANLHIENIAVVRRADIDLGEGLTVITGETGAGKSVLIDSIKLLSASVRGVSLYAAARTAQLLRDCLPICRTSCSQRSPSSESSVRTESCIFSVP